MKPSIWASLALSIFVLPGCAGIAKSNAEYKQAKEDFAASLDQQSVAAEEGYTKGMAIYDAYMADGPPPTPTSVQGVQDWIDQRWPKIANATEAFKPVHNGPMSTNGYRSHLALGNMAARLGEEVMAAGEALPPEENQTLHKGGGPLDIFDRAHKHLNAWEPAGYNEALASEKDALASEIEAAHTKRDRMQELREKSIAIGEG